MKTRVNTAASRCPAGSVGQPHQAADFRDGQQDEHGQPEERAADGDGALGHIQLRHSWHVAEISEDVARLASEVEIVVRRVAGELLLPPLVGRRSRSRMVRASSPAASAKIGIDTVVAAAYASVICPRPRCRRASPTAPVALSTACSATRGCPRSGCLPRLEAAAQVGPDVLAQPPSLTPVEQRASGGTGQQRAQCEHAPACPGGDAPPQLARDR